MTPNWKMRTRVPQIEDQLMEYCQEAWENIPIEYLNSLVDSIPTRIEHVIKRWDDKVLICYYMNFAKPFLIIQLV